MDRHLAVGIDRSEEEGEGELAIHREQDLIPISVMQILEEKLGKYCRFSTFNSTGSSDAQIGVIVAIDEEKYPDRSDCCIMISAKKPERSLQCPSLLVSVTAPRTSGHDL